MTNPYYNHTPNVPRSMARFTLEELRTEFDNIGAGFDTVASTSGGGTSVTGTAPVVSSGGTTPAISMAAATASVNGYMTSTYATKLDGIATSATANVGTVTSVAALTLGTTGTDASSSVATGTTTPAITLNLPSASSANRGLLTSTDWTTFNNKQPSGSYLTAAVTSISFGTTGLTPSAATNGAVSVAGTLAVGNGGTGATSSDTAPFALKGANSDITSLTGLTTALSVAQGGTGLTASGNSGNVLTSNGTIWTSAAIPASSVMTVAVVTTTSQTAVAGTHYVLTNVSATNVTLPAGTSGDTVWVTWTNTLATNTVTPNGAETIMDVAGAMTLDASIKGTVQLRYVASSWRII